MTIQNNEYKKQWRLDNKEKIRLYRKKNRIKIAQQTRAYYLKHKEDIAKWYKEYMIDNETRLEKNRRWKRDNSEYSKSYYKTYDGRKAIDKSKAKRRMLGFIPINEPFEGCEGHHIDMEHVVYIPKEIHRSINHNVFTWYNMDAINVLTIPYIGII